jgi:hypothetical protein
MMGTLRFAHPSEQVAEWYGRLPDRLVDMRG